MARRNRQNANEPQLKFHQKLLLNRYMLGRFGVSNFTELAEILKNPALEEIDDEGVTGFYKQISSVLGAKCRITREKLAEYDLNIVAHLAKINEKRDEPLSLKYYQYLSLLFVEYYLDNYFNNRQGLLDGLNALASEFNEKFPNDAIELYKEGDLNKIAIWNATGSGKTLIMHINYHQYKHYSGGKLPDGATYILLTPKEGLSLQHIEEFGVSGIPARIYDKSASRWMRSEGEISVLENTKLGEKDQDAIVSVRRFGNRNVVFVDEGHRGSSSGKEGKWQKYRDELCSDGFSFEYSATFGQAIAASTDKSLAERYQKCIIFDYSYKYFYQDGYGKDYNILNLADDSDESKRRLYLTGCLLSFYQQKKLFLSHREEFERFNIENPLFVFVGASVNAVRTERGRKVSDVVDILLFFNDFVSNTGEATANIRRLLSGNTGLLDSHKRDIFRNAFPYLESVGLSPDELYKDILKTVFNCSSVGAMLHVENLRGVGGEISLRLGENEPFGVINVGDDGALLKLCSENGFHTDTISFSESLFHKITKQESSINILIGSKKFTEGWNCWRVSTMGLMNVGRTGGSEITQLFGRGVRLKGHAMSLKRSAVYKKENPDVSVPRHISVLETLNIFGVRADYMNQFREFLEAEGVPSEKGQKLVLTMPVIQNREFKKDKLYTLRVRGGLDYRKHGEKPFLRYVEGVVVTLDCYAKVQFESSKTHSSNEVTKYQATLRPEHLAFLNYDRIYFELLRYKNKKARYNVNIRKSDIYDLLNNPEHNTSWYRLLIPEDELAIRSFEDYRRFEKIALSLLIKYFDRLYYLERNRWESMVVGYELVPMIDPSLASEENEEISISIGNTDENEAMIAWLRRIIDKVNEAKAKNQIPDFIEQRSDMEIIGFPAHLYSPLLHLAGNNVEISVSPVALNESEAKFIKDLRQYLNDNASHFSDKELYLIRNRSRKGTGFFEDSGFYPDFIMWLISNGKQYISFIDPHGMGRESISSSKIRLHKDIKTQIQSRLSNPSVELASFILSPTKYAELPDKSIPKAEWMEHNVLFMEDLNYIQKLFETIEK